MIIVEEVQSKDQKKEFLEFPAQLYQHDKNYIRPLDQNIEEIFDPKKISSSKMGNVRDFCLKRSQNHW